MIVCMQMVPMRHMGMISCLFMISGGIMFGCFPVMVSCVLIVFRRCFVMLNGLSMIVFAFWHSQNEVLVCGAGFHSCLINKRSYDEGERQRKS